MNLSGKDLISKAVAIDPAWEDWEAVRRLITQLWYEQDKSIDSVVSLLQDEHKFKVSPKTLKGKLRQWGLHKKLNENDAEDLLASHYRMDVLGRQAIHLLYGRIENLQRVHEYQRRRGRKSSQNLRSSQAQTMRGVSNVIALSPHPRMRPGPSMMILAGLEAVLRELRVYLERARHEKLCELGQTSLNWTKSAIAETQGQEFKHSIWEGVRAFEDGSFEWAGLCWRLALLQMEQFLWYNDLDLWTTFVQCCIRLQRFGASEVGRHFFQQLQGLRHLLPLSAPHRPLLYALTDISFDELIHSGIFFLEAKLRNIELLWAENPCVYTDYETDLAEERFYHGFENPPTESPAIEDLDKMSLEEVLDRSAIQVSQVFGQMILLDYQKAEKMVQNWIRRLENDTDKEIFRSTLNLHLAPQYVLLGRIQYYQHKMNEACKSFIAALSKHEAILVASGQGALELVQVHRIYTLLEWLSSLKVSDLATTVDPFEMKTLKNSLEEEVWREVKARKDKPWQHGMVNPASRLKQTAYPRTPSQHAHRHRRLSEAMKKSPEFASVDEEKCLGRQHNSKFATSEATVTRISHWLYRDDSRGRDVGDKSLTPPKGELAPSILGVD